MNDDLQEGLTAFNQQAEHIRALATASQPVIAYARILGERLNALDRSVFTPELRTALASHAHIAKAVMVDSGALRVLREQAQMARQWEQTVFPKLGILETLAALEAAAGPTTRIVHQMAEMQKAMALTRGLLVGVPVQSLGNSVHLTDGPRQRILRRMADMSSTFANLQGAMQSRQELRGILAATAARPAVEVFTNAHLISTITVVKPAELEVEAASFATEVEAQAHDDLLALLDGVNPELRRMWVGGAQALASDNPDRLRHFSTSMRELVTHVLHRLAPDDEIKRWTTDPSHFHNSRPTRKARLLYIYRGIGSAEVTDFVKSDVASVTAFIDLFQRGVHGEAVAYNETQAFAFQVRMEAILRFMIELARIARS